LAGVPARRGPFEERVDFGMIGRKPKWIIGMGIRIRNPIAEWAKTLTPRVGAAT
jgi:hypothetical protein